MFINVPYRLKRNDIKHLGKIYKGDSNSYILTDFKNKTLKNKVELKSRSWFDNVYDILDTYLFISDGIKEKINFVDEILRFEYDLKCVRTVKWTTFQSLEKVQIPNKTIQILSKEKYLLEDFIKYDYNTDYEINKYGVVKTMFTDDYVITKKSKNIGGYIVKYEHSNFSF